MSFLFRSVAVARSAAVASAAVRPAALAPAFRFTPLASAPSLSSLRFSSSTPSSSTSAFTSTASPAAAASRTARPAMDLSGISHLIPSKVAEEDPDAWWRKTDITLDRNFGKPGNQYTGRSYPVKGNYTTAYQRLSTTLARTGTRAELNRAQYYERPSERKRRLRSHRWRRRFQEEVRQRVQIVQMLRSRK